MKRALGVVWLSGIVTMAAEPVKSGKATAEWLAESSAVQGGQALRTAVRLVIEPEWHTYWLNPGEAGMPTQVKWELPDGWKAGVFFHPVPKPFLTGALAGFGHDGTVLFPVELTAPSGFEGEAQLTATVSWLACNDDACVPGEAQLTLDIIAGAPSPTPAAPDIMKSFAAKPMAAPDSVRLDVKEEGKNVVLTISGAPPVDPSLAAVYAQSPDRLDPTARIVFEKSGDSWQAKVAKNQYATDPITGLELLFVAPSAQRGFLLHQKN